MAYWIRFLHGGQPSFGTLEGDVIRLHEGDLFGSTEPKPCWLRLSGVEILAPSSPSKIVALWNNFHALADRLKVPVPQEPLYLLKAPSSAAAPGTAILRPRSYDGKVVYEGELGIVIGRTCRDAAPEEAERCIFGYTCVNDVTAAELIDKEPAFAQWARAKSFDGFTPFGPVIATGLRADQLVVRTLLNGEERQSYPLSDCVFPPAELVSRLSRDMTLLPGDLICCGTSLGVGAMKEPHNTVEVVIEGVGRLINSFINEPRSTRTRQSRRTGEDQDHGAAAAASF